MGFLCLLVVYSQGTNDRVKLGKASHKWESKQVKESYIIERLNKRDIAMVKKINGFISIKNIDMYLE